MWAVSSLTGWYGSLSLGCLPCQDGLKSWKLSQMNPSFRFFLRLFYQSNSMPTHVLLSPTVLLPCNGNLPRFLTVWSGSLCPHKCKDFLLPKIPLCLLWPAHLYHTTHFGLTSRLLLMLVCNFANFVIKVLSSCLPLPVLGLPSCWVPHLLPLPSLSSQRLCLFCDFPPPLALPP